MGTYWQYVNHTKRECVSLSHLRDGGDKWGAALTCAPALVYLLGTQSYGYDFEGRWRTDKVEIVADGAQDSSYPDIRFHSDYLIRGYAKDCHPNKYYTDISIPLLEELKRQYGRDWGNLFQDWKPRNISFQPEDLLVSVNLQEEIKT